MISKKYKKWIEQQPCICHGLHGGDVVGHHERTNAGGGIGMKPGDEHLLPLCHLHHNERHNKGAKTFAEKYAIDYDSQKIKHLSRFIEEVQK